jgi:hypothetical protein
MQNVYPIVNVLNTLPATELPSVGAFLGLVILYVLLLGPGNYLILRRLRRQELSWVTIPVMAVLFCAGTFLFALQAKGSDVVINAVSVIHLDATSGPRATETYLGLFSPTRSDYHLAIPDAALPEALPMYNYGPNWNGGAGPGDGSVGLVFTQGEPTTVDFTGMSMWSMRAVVLQHETSMAGSIDAQLHLGAGGAIAGTVTNRTGLELVDAALVTAGGAQVLGALAPHRGAAVNLAANGSAAVGPPPIYQLYQNAPGVAPGAMVAPALAAGSPVRWARGIKGQGKVIYAGAGPITVSSGPAGMSQDAQTYSQVLQTVFQNGDTSSVAPILFLAWNHTPLTALTVNGDIPRRQDLNLIVQPLWLDLGQGPFTLPEGVVAPRLVATDSTNQAGGLNISPGNSATFDFTVPAGGHAVAVDQLSVNISTNGGPSVIQSDTGALYDWATHQWETVDLSNGDTHFAHAGRFVSHQGVVRLRLTAPDSQNLYINNIGANIQIGVVGTVH